MNGSRVNVNKMCLEHMSKVGNAIIITGHMIILTRTVIVSTINSFT